MRWPHACAQYHRATVNVLSGCGRRTVRAEPAAHDVLAGYPSKSGTTFPWAPPSWSCDAQGPEQQLGVSRLLLESKCDMLLTHDGPEPRRLTSPRHGRRPGSSSSSCMARQPAPSRSSNCPERSAHRNAPSPNAPSASAQGTSQASDVMTFASARESTCAYAGATRYLSPQWTTATSPARRSAA